jgi:phenylalanyl-tRNA synthetase beta chain
MFIQQKIKELEFTLRYKRVKKVLGYEIDPAKQLAILKSLGMKIIKNTDEDVTVNVPSFRPDIEREVDLIEEIARINGYDNIPAVKKITITLGEKADESSFAAMVRETASGLGFLK